MGRRSKYSPELRERAVRMVFEHAPEYPSQGAIRSVAEKIGCPVEVLRPWVLQSTSRKNLRRRGSQIAERERAPMVRAGDSNVAN